MVPVNLWEKTYYIIRGTIGIYSLQETGEETLLFIHKDKEIFPMMCPFSPINTDQEFRYQALTDLLLLSLEKEKFCLGLESNHRLQIEACQLLTNLYNCSLNLIDCVKISPIYPRLIKTLLFLTNYFGDTPCKDSIIIKPYLTHGDLAKLIGSSRESVSRKIAILKNKEMIDYRKSQIIIKDIDRLRKELYDYNPLTI